MIPPDTRPYQQKDKMSTAQTAPFPSLLKPLPHCIAHNIQILQGYPQRGRLQALAAVFVFLTGAKQWF